MSTLEQIAALSYVIAMVRQAARRFLSPAYCGPGSVGARLESSQIASPLPVTIIPPFGVCANAAIARSISPTSCMLTGVRRFQGMGLRPESRPTCRSRL
jgi:hypothetical protein